VLARIQEHVSERVSHLARRLQRAQVVAPEQGQSLAFEHPVHGPGQAGSDRLHTAPERILSGRFHHEVHMIALDRLVADAELAAFAAGAHPRLEVADEPAAAQRWNVTVHAHRDVGRTADGHPRAPDVVHGRTRRGGLTPGALALTAMSDYLDASQGESDLLD
jgi:hypothetical protein